MSVGGCEEGTCVGGCVGVRRALWMTDYIV